jgi:hypothetical protein
MSWIDTPLVRDAREDLTAFGRMIATLPPPMNKTTSVEACGKAFAAGIAGRKRRIFVPGWVSLAAAARTLLNSRLLEVGALRHIPTLLPLMDEEVRRLGRSTSLRNVELSDEIVDR